MTQIDELVDGIYRISTTFAFDGFDFQFNQFLIDDERPALIHTGMHAMYDGVRGSVGEVLDLGRHKLRLLETPHVHHWDSMMLFDEKTKSVFPSDLFIQPGDQPPVVTENLGGEIKSNACTGAQSCGTSAPAYHTVDEERR